MQTKPNTKSGHYLGTEINEKWWSRYRKDGLLARGNGEYWISNNCLCFRKYLTKSEIIIPLNEINEIKLGKWHAGRWAGGALIIKLIWYKNSMKLSSGFVISKDFNEAMNVVQSIKKLNQSIYISIKQK